MNPFVMVFLVIAGQKCAKQRWPPRPLIKLCGHQNIVQYYKIHELLLILRREIHF